ncbi:MAG: AAA family ATPase [Prevotellaceae bacterium]|jgi:exodeoxyribonuclease-5|nr:AAA family ATPase [Prevotellaceae bacterium]
MPAFFITFVTTLKYTKITIADFIYRRLSEHLPHTPTQGQAQLFRELAGFIPDTGGYKIFVIGGYAGTGKTTAIAALVSLLGELKINTLLLAPTGRAAKVLSNYTGKNAFTIHKKIYRQKSLDDGIGQFVLNRNEYSDAIIIVDEASMIANGSPEQSIFGGGRLLDDLVTFVNNGKRCKLVLAGDNAQLPPVGWTQSPALDIQEMHRYGLSGHTLLTDVVRQAAQSGILTNATLLREHIEHNIPQLPAFSFHPFPDVELITGGEVMEKLSEAYDRYGDRETIVVCRSNKRANRYNQGIRAKIQYREEQLTPGDRIMVVKNAYQNLAGDMDFIANGDIADLMRIRKYEERYGLHFAEAELRFPDYNNTELTAKILLDALLSETPSLSSDRQRQLFLDISEDYAHISSRQKRYRAVREDAYYNALQIKYAAAVTCHKAQGGQWKAVFLDYPFFNDAPLSIDDLRWLYTAFTRATEKLYLVNFKN